jgi:hypothetical protein
MQKNLLTLMVLANVIICSSIDGCYSSGYINRTDYAKYTLLDSGCSRHLTKDFDSLTNVVRLKTSIPILFGNNKTLNATHVGTMNIKIPTANGAYHIMAAHNALYVPGITQNLLSINELTKDHGRVRAQYSIIFDKKDQMIHKESKLVIPITYLKREDGGTNLTYVQFEPLNDYDKQFLCHNAELTDQMHKQQMKNLLIHYKCGHLSKTKMKQEEQQGRLPSGSHNFGTCDFCKLAKGKRQNVSKGPSLTQYKHNELVATDIKVMPSPSKDGSVYILGFIEASTRELTCYYMKRKSEVPKYTEKFFKEKGSRYPFGAALMIPPIDTIQSDNESVFISEAFQKVCTKYKVKHRYSSPYTPSENGLIERVWRTILEKTRAMLFTMGMPRDYWCLAWQHATFLYNNTAHTKTGEAPNPSHHIKFSSIPIFGSKAWCFLYPHKRNKLDPTTKVGWFIGMCPNSTAATYKVYIPSVKKVYTTRDVEFDESIRFKGDYLEKYLKNTVSDEPHNDEDQQQIDFQHINHAPTLDQLPDSYTSSEIDDNAELQRFYLKWFADYTTKHKEDAVGEIRELQMRLMSEEYRRIKRATTPGEGDNFARKHNIQDSILPIQIEIPNDKISHEIIDQQDSKTPDEPNDAPIIKPNIEQQSDKGSRNSSSKNITSAKTRGETSDEKNFVVRNKIMKKKKKFKPRKMITRSETRNDTIHPIKVCFSSSEFFRTTLPDGMCATDLMLEAVCYDDPHIVDTDGEISCALANDKNEFYEPKNLYDALSCSNKDRWFKALRKEYESLISLGTWKLVPLPPGRKPIKNVWVFKVKRTKDGNVDKYKARLCVAGYSQIQGIDYNEVFSPVISMKSVKIVFNRWLQKNYYIRHVDINNAFPTTPLPLENKIYMNQPKPFVAKGKEHLVCEILKAQYGLKQASREFNLMLTKWLINNNFQQLETDPCIFVNRNTGTEIGLYVDDLIIGSRTLEEAHKFESLIQGKFKVDVRGTIQHFLGIRINYKRGEYLFMDQEAYIQQCCEKFHIDNSRKIKIPTSGTNRLPTTKQNDDPVDINLYQQKVGSLIYALHTRSECTHAISDLSRHMSNPNQIHMSAADKVFKYLICTSDMGIKFTKSNGPNNAITYSEAKANVDLKCYSDSSYASEPETCRSTSGHVVFVDGNPVTVYSHLDKLVYKSSTESEFCALSGAFAEVLYLRQVLMELDGISDPSKIAAVVYEDNKSALHLAKHPVVNSRTKHVNVKFFFVRQHVKPNGDIELIYCPTTKMIADGCTKNLSANKFREHRLGLKITRL